ncbi:6,7-dimethyl-8-ribityllumazine synthase [Parasutterella excrementihominis]|uniref:6,7-dimethyl-8-ribityllumazine synthase n=1 Tax=Parasutterella excrementihominis TaxID=487175 RepID=UPI003FEDAC54
MSIEFIKPNADGSDLKIGIVSARFNDWACDAMFASCYEELKAHGVKDENIVVTTVPGALEIPGALVMLYEGYPDLDALVAIGCVIRGETYHFELVANESSRGVTNFVMTEGISVANCILTVENEEQAKARVQEKGADAARVTLEMGNLRRFCGQRVMENFGEDDGQ